MIKYQHPISLEAVSTTPVGQRANVVGAIECADGTSLSVQASASHYCDPRDNDGPWDALEVGYPSAPPPASWDVHQDGAGSSIYACVPVRLIQEFIAAHGGEKAS